MISHINERGNSVYISVAVIKNIVSGKKNLDNKEVVAVKANYLVLGEEEYLKFKDEEKNT